MIPMPNDTLNGRTVVASTYYRDLTERDRQFLPEDDWPNTVYLVLLLNSEPPYFTVAHVADTESGEEKWRTLNSEDRKNIVEAINDLYTQWGGDI